MKILFTALASLVLLGCKGQEKELPASKDPGMTSKSVRSGSAPDAGPGESVEKATEFKVKKTEAEWRAELSDMAFYVLRREGTEPPGSSELLRIKQPGTFVCAGCGTPVFKSEHKFESGTGWPSFDREIEGNVAYSVDYKIGVKRIEEHCATCGGHLGHVFEDGPRATTGLRHCINGAALAFIPEQ